MKHGAADLQFHLFLTSEVEVSGHLHTAAALPPGKEPPVPTEQGLGRPWAGLDAFGKKNPLPLSGIEQFHIHPSRSLVTMPTEVSRLLYIAKKEPMIVKYHENRAWKHLRLVGLLVPRIQSAKEANCRWAGAKIFHSYRNDTET